MDPEERARQARAAILRTFAAIIKPQFDASGERATRAEEPVSTIAAFEHLPQQEQRDD